MRAFVWSDQHFFHLPVIRYAKRPFPFNHEGLMQSHRYMLEKYQSKVQEDDLVIFLGDVAEVNSEQKESLKELFAQMPGYKVLIRGNHDKLSDKFYRSLGFVAVYDYLIAADVFFCHYPLAATIVTRLEKICYEALKQSGCQRIFHGHMHNVKVEATDGIERRNFCVDYEHNDYRPLEITDAAVLEDLENIYLKTSRRLTPL